MTWSHDISRYYVHAAELMASIKKIGIPTRGTSDVRERKSCKQQSEDTDSDDGVGSWENDDDEHGGRRHSCPRTSSSRHWDMPWLIIRKIL